MGWLDIFSQFIRVGSYIFMDIAALIFWIYGELLTTYYKNLADDIAGNTLAIKDFVRFSLIYPQLSSVTTFLCKDFAFILLVNCTHAISCLFFHCDALAFESDPKLMVFIIWDFVTVFDCLIRLWSICQTADKIRLAVFSTLA